MEKKTIPLKPWVKSQLEKKGKQTARSFGEVMLDKNVLTRRPAHPGQETTGKKKNQNAVPKTGKCRHRKRPPERKHPENR